MTKQNINLLTDSLFSVQLELKASNNELKFEPDYFGLSGSFHAVVVPKIKFKYGNREEHSIDHRRGEIGISYFRRSSLDKVLRFIEKNNLQDAINDKFDITKNLLNQNDRPIDLQEFFKPEIIEELNERYTGRDVKAKIESLTNTVIEKAIGTVMDSGITEVIQLPYTNNLYLLTDKTRNILAESNLNGYKVMPLTISKDFFNVETIYNRGVGECEFVLNMRSTLIHTVEFFDECFCIQQLHDRENFKFTLKDDDTLGMYYSRLGGTNYPFTSKDIKKIKREDFFKQEGRFEGFFGMEEQHLAYFRHLFSKYEEAINKTVENPNYALEKVNYQIRENFFVGDPVEAMKLYCQCPSVNKVFAILEVLQAENTHKMEIERYTINSDEEQDKIAKNMPSDAKRMIEMLTIHFEKFDRKIRLSSSSSLFGCDIERLLYSAFHKAIENNELVNVKENKLFKGYNWNESSISI